MTGRLIVGKFVAEIDGGGWKTESKLLQKMLNDRFPIVGSSPADGRPGAGQLRDAARALGGKVEWTEQPVAEPGVVY